MSIATISARFIGSTTRAADGRRPGLLLLALVAACTRYEPAPVAPADLLGDYLARDLRDTSVIAFARESGVASGPAWSDRELALAAVWFRPGISAAIERFAAAIQESHAAGARPAVALDADLERAIGGTDRESPWVAALASRLTFDPGGRREARRASARARAAAAEAALWQHVADLRHAVRIAVAELWLAHADSSAAVALGVAAERVESSATQRYAEGMLAGWEVARARRERVAAGTAVGAASARVGLARVRLAESVGVAPEKLEGLRPTLSTETGCDRLLALTADSARTVALNNRPEVALGLARYAVAEAGLREQIAAQYPLIEAGPGIVWDQGVTRWAIGAGLPQGPGTRRSAAIAASRSERLAAAADLASAQDSIAGEVGAAVSRCAAARTATGLADSAAASAETLLATTVARYERGEVGVSEVALAELERSNARMMQGQASAVALRADVGVSRVVGNLDDDLRRRVLASRRRRADR